ncbi:MAG: hypothetical protein LBI19_09585 [Oscillospiraceae bacterium]|jgi:hypothetical protein|nr:hypothetical protein [Oscillospiraceae bacterium]
MINKITVISFLAVLFTVFFLNVLRDPDELSFFERRRLAQMPELTADGLLSGKFMSDFDDFAVDQMMFREQYRRLKAVFDLNVLRKLDNNGIFIRNGMVFKTEYPLNESSIRRLCETINTVHSLYLDGLDNVYYTIVPDKNAYLQNSGHLVLDYGRMEDAARGFIKDEIGYISLFGALSLEDYFRTDSHWRQERLSGVVDALAAGLGAVIDPKPYAEQHFDRFYGVYYGQSALNIDPDDLTYLVSETTDNAVVTSVEKPGEIIPVYDLTQLGAMDSYSMFMGGPAAIVTAQNPQNSSGRGLILFRDSYASSLSPLLLDGYSTITLVDLRYVNPEMVGEFVEFTNQDVLFIYSATLFNTSDSVRAPGAFVSPFVARGRIG